MIAKASLACVILLGLGLMTHARSSLWGNTQDQASLWAKLNPESPRAQANAAQFDMQTGHTEHAVARLRPLLAQQPDQVQLAFNLFDAECRLGRVDPATLDATRKALRTTRDPGKLLVHWFTRVMAQTAHPPCPQLDESTIADLLDDMAANTHLAGIAGRQQDLYYLRGRLALQQGKAGEALADFNEALDKQVRVAAALEQAALLGSHGHPRLGLAHLDHYEAENRQADQPEMGMPAIHSWLLQRQHYWDHELKRLRATLGKDAAGKAPDQS
jgi:tetratricopeptide (TPR) repeat protein